MELFPSDISDGASRIPDEYMKKFVYEDEASAFQYISINSHYGYGLKWETDKFYVVILRE